MADAVFSAGILNTCLRHAGTVRMANMAPVVNARGPLYVHPGGIVKRTTFHVLQMFANLLEENVADAWTSGDRLEGSEHPGAGCCRHLRLAGRTGDWCWSTATPIKRWPAT